MDTIEEILNEKGIKFVHSGKDYVVRCFNPQHEDSNPSMRIDKLSGIFNCFSCGYSGNLFTRFNIYHNNLNTKVQKLKDKIKDLMNNKLTMPLGYHPFHKDYRGISKETYKHFNAFTCNDEKMSNKVIIPITDIFGDINYFIGRELYTDQEPRYTIFPRDANLGLFPAKPELIDNSIILVEGIFDMLNLWDKGLTNAVCTFGTSFGSVKKKAKKLKVLEKITPYILQGATKIYIMYDADEPGLDAAENLASILEEYVNVEVISLPDDSDPGDLTQDFVNKIKSRLYESSNN